jgi:CheY-like chemotaxis protein
MTRLRDMVLIADSDVERAERLAASCAERGVDVQIAAHGARALEIALAELPVALVTQLDLPLIEGARLAEILRANPRTESTGILFIADERTVPPGGDAAGSVLPGHADPETIAHFVQALLLKHRPPREDNTPEPLGGIEGELAQLPLSELIELFHMNRKTGRILLQRGPVRRRQSGQVALHEGDVVHAATGQVQGEKALYRLFAWKRGRFQFVPDPVIGELSIDRPTRVLLREGRRQAAEWDRLAGQIPPAHSRASLVVAREDLPSVLHPLTQEVLLALEGTDRVDQVMDRCAFPDYQVLRTLVTLVRRGIVELRSGGHEASARAGQAAVPRGVAARIRERMERTRCGGDAKVLVLASGDDAAHALAARIGALPGASEAPASIPANAMAPLGQLDLDEETAVRWIAAPADARFRPIWPTGAYGALAVLFAHAGPVEQSVQSLRSAIDAIGSLPRVRTLHALFSEKAGEGAAASLCEALALFDDRRVVEIPLDAGREGDEAFRELLRRVLA